MINHTYYDVITKHRRLKKAIDLHIGAGKSMSSWLQSGQICKKNAFLKEKSSSRTISICLKKKNLAALEQLTPRDGSTRLAQNQNFGREGCRSSKHHQEQGWVRKIEKTEGGRCRRTLPALLPAQRRSWDIGHVWRSQWTSSSHMAFHYSGRCASPANAAHEQMCDTHEAKGLHRRSWTCFLKQPIRLPSQHQQLFQGRQAVPQWALRSTVGLDHIRFPQT